MGKCRMPLITGGGGGDGIEVVTTAGDLGAFKRGLGTDGSGIVNVSIALPSKPAGSDWYQSFIGFKYMSDDVAIALWEDYYSYYGGYGSSSYECRLKYAVYQDGGSSLTQLSTGTLWTNTTDLAVYLNFNDFTIEGNTLVTVGTHSLYSGRTYVFSGTINADYTISNVKTLQHTGTNDSEDYSGLAIVHAIDDTHFVYGTYKSLVSYSTKNSYPTEHLVHLTIGSSLTTKNLDTAFEYCSYYGMAVGKYKGGLVFLGIISSRTSLRGSTYACAAFITASGAIYYTKSATQSDQRYVPLGLGAFHLGNGKFLFPTGSLTWLFTLNDACTAWTVQLCGTTDFPGITDIGAKTVVDSTTIIGVRPLAHNRAIVDIEDAVAITNRQYLGVIREDAGEYGVLQLGENTALTSMKVNPDFNGYSSTIGGYMIASPFKCSRSDMRIKGFKVEVPYKGEFMTVHIANIESLLKLTGRPNGTYSYKKSGDKVTWLI